MQPVSLGDYCREARSSIQAGDPDKAISITRHILRHYPRHLESYRTLGQALQAAGNLQQAARQFQRVLSADPEDMASRLGLAEIHAAGGDLDKAIWQAQRARESSPDDPDLRVRLSRLASDRQAGEMPALPELTRVALGYIHARAGLYTKAIQEFKAGLAYDPDRLDVQTALAEALWRAGRRLEAAEVCHSILEKLPNALKANLIIAAVWLTNSQPSEAERHLRVAQALDPENTVAQSLLGDKSPLPPATATIERLGEDEIADTQLRPPPTTTAQGVAVSQPPEPAIDWTSELHEAGAMATSNAERPDEEFELPDWLKGLDDGLDEEQERTAAPVSPEGEARQEEAVPGWLRNLVSRTEETGVSAESPPAEPGELPDWLQELRPEIPPKPSPGSGTPDWLASMATDQTADYFEPEPVSAPGEPVPLPSASEAYQPDWPTEVGISEERFASPAGEGEPIAKAEEGRALWEQISTEQGVGVPTEETKPSMLEPVGGIVEEWDVPDWLRDIAAGEDVEPAESPPVTAAPTALPEVEVDAADLPDWLRDFEKLGVEEPAADLHPELPQVAAPPPPSLEEGRALWEQILTEEGLDLTSAQEAPPLEAAGLSAEEWLRSTANLAQSATPPKAEQPPLELPEAPAMPTAKMEEGETGPPAWLRDVGKPFEEETSAAVPAEASPVSDWLPETTPAPTGVSDYQAGLPDWLRQIVAGGPSPAEAGEPATPAAKAETPDWLSELQEPAAEVQPPAPPEAMLEPTPEDIVETRELPQIKVEETELPDWLREPLPETADLAEPVAEPSAEMPEWLTELESEEILLTETDFEQPLELETSEMPAWLGEIMAGEPPLSEAWAAVSDLGGPTQAETPKEPIPDWLRDYQAREWQVTAEPAEAEVEPEPLPQAQVQPEYPPQPELPDWLTRLREGVPEEAPALVPTEPSLAEAEVMPPVTEAMPAMELFPEVEAVQPETVGPGWLGELVRAEESLAELEAISEEEPVAPAPEEYVERVPGLPTTEPARFVPEMVEAAAPPAMPAAKPLITRELGALQVEELPRDPAARLSMARAALNAGDWAEALIIYQTLVTGSEMLDSVIDNLQVGLRRHPDDAAGYELLGDAYMKDGRLSDALQAYRTALGKL